MYRCTSLVSCYCVLTEKIDKNDSVVTIDHFSRLQVRSLLVSYWRLECVAWRIVASHCEVGALQRLASQLSLIRALLRQEVLSRGSIRINYPEFYVSGKRRIHHHALLNHTHRNITSKFVTPTAPSCMDNSWRSTTLQAADSASSNQTLPFQNEHSEYWKNSDNWIICCQKFSSDVLISTKVSFFMWLRKVLMICK